jgi:DNA polymerase I
VERLMLLDGYGLVYRAFFALPDLTTSKGVLVKGVFGFASIVLRGLADLKPDYLAVSFDLPGPTFRHEQYAEYKATRTKMPDELRDQFPMVRAVVNALRIPVYELQGYEADDVIGTITRQMEPLDLETTIVTVDLDMLQLVTEKTRLMTTRSGVENTVIYDIAKIDERFGLRPDQMIDYKALKGDPTDNIPGVPGVGEKTAAKLIGQYETLDALYERLDTVTPEKLRDKLGEHRDQVFLGRELSRIVRDLPITLDLEAARLGDYDRETVVRLFREYEFRTLIDRLPPLLGEDEAARMAALRGETAGGTFPAAQVPGRSPGWRPPPAPSGGQLSLTLDFDAVSAGTRAAGGPGTNGTPGTGHAAETPIPAGDLPAALRAAIADPGRIEVVEAAGVAGLEAWIAQQPAVGLGQVIADPRPLAGTPHALAVAGADGRVVSAAGPEASVALRRLVERLDRPLVAHDVKPFLVARLADDPAGRLSTVAFDTQIAAYLVNAALRSQKIDDVVAERLDLVLPPPAASLPAVATAGLEALGALAVRPSLEGALADEGVERLFAEVELPLVPILARMEANGIALDRAAVAELDTEFTAEIKRLERAIFDAVGHEFTIGSPKQLGDILFVELGLPKGRRTKTGYSTDASVLEELRGVHPVVEPILEWRIYTKLRSTYIEALPTLLGPDDRLHTTFHQAVAATGRLSSSDPNLQNIPIRTDLGRRIRRAFVAGSPDTTLVAADYSQIELRILAHVSSDVHLQEAFARELDIHRETAARVLRKPPEEVTADERSMAKMVNFGLAYGMSDFGLSSRAGISRQEAQEFINSYFAAYSGISYYMMAIKETAKAEGQVATLLGRKRRIPELRMANRALVAAGERMAINMPIQGTAADIVKIAMIRLDQRLRDEGFAARLLLQVHDELLLEAPESEVERLVPILRETMEGALPLSVPLTVDVKVGRSWEGMTPVTRRDAVLAEADELPPEPVAGAPAG